MKGTACQKATLKYFKMLQDYNANGEKYCNVYHAMKKKMLIHPERANPLNKIDQSNLIKSAGTYY